MVKKLRKQTKQFIATSATLGVGSLAVSNIGGSTAAASGAGLNTLAGFQSPLAVGMGGAAVVRSLSMLQPTKKGRARRLKI